MSAGFVYKAARGHGAEGGVASWSKTGPEDRGDDMIERRTQAMTTNRVEGLEGGRMGIDSSQALSVIPPMSQRGRKNRF